MQNSPRCKKCKGNSWTKTDSRQVSQPTAAGGHRVIDVYMCRYCGSEKTLATRVAGRV